MLIGRWSSDAFLRYIRKQVEQFSRNVAKKMLTFRSFRHIPNIAPGGFRQKTHGSATILKMPRQGEILDATNHYERSDQPSPCTPNRLTRRRKQLMEEHLFPTAEGVGEGSGGDN
jgi:hypothetical protein